MQTAKSGYSGDNRVFRYRPMTIEEAKGITYGEHHALAHNGVIRRVRSNGAVKTWKRDNTRIEVPLKYGMYEAFRDSSRNGETMEHLIVLLDCSGNPTRDESTATV
jgi:hypothetical protein